MFQAIFVISRITGQSPCNARSLISFKMASGSSSLSRPSFLFKRNSSSRSRASPTTARLGDLRPGTLAFLSLRTPSSLIPNPKSLPFLTTDN